MTGSRSFQKSIAMLYGRYDAYVCCEWYRLHML